MLGQPLSGGRYAPISFKKYAQTHDVALEFPSITSESLNFTTLKNKTFSINFWYKKRKVITNNLVTQYL